MSTVIAEELHTIVMRAAQPVRPGEPIKSQQNRAWLNLGRPALWRLKAAWWRDGSGAWSAAAVRDFQARFQAFLDREARRHHQADATKASPAAENSMVQIERDAYRQLVARIDALEHALRVRG